MTVVFNARFHKKPSSHCPTLGFCQSFVGSTVAYQQSEVGKGPAGVSAGRKIVFGLPCCPIVGGRQCGRFRRHAVQTSVFRQRRFLLLVLLLLLQSLTQGRDIRFVVHIVDQLSQTDGIKS